MESKKEIQKLYEKYISQDIDLTEEYKKSSKEFAKKVEEFEQNLKIENFAFIKEFEEICKLMSKMQEEQAKKSFEIGYSMGVNLTLEALLANMTALILLPSSFIVK